MKLLRYTLTLLTLFCCLVIASTATFAQDDESPWIEGPAMVDVGNNLAQLDLGEAYAYTGADTTQQIMEMMGNVTSGTEVGMLIPTAEEESWFIIFEHDAIGYVPDDEKDDLDATAILDSIREGTEAANEYRIEQGIAPLNVIGWHTKPFYDTQTNNLVWSVLAESEDETGTEQSVNHNIRILGRTGYMSAVLVADPTELDQLIPETEAILANFSYKPGKKYADYIQGDKLAEYGLTALVAGGVGAAAVKTGFLNVILKNIKLVGIAILAFFGGIWRWIKGMASGKDEYAATMPDHSSTDI